MVKDLKGLFVAHRRELLAYLTGLLRDAETAADLTQETFLRYARQSQEDGAAVLHARSYLYRTARNLAIDHVRQQARRRTDAVADETLSRIAADRPSAEDDAVSRQRLAALQQAVDELPERTRTVFVLCRIDGIPHREVARQLGISLSAVQKHLAAALQYAMQRARP